jgi:hypothetical protein
MTRTTLAKLVVVVVLLAVAAFRVWRWMRHDRGVSEQALFYDLSEQKLFAGPRNAVPPIRGINDLQTDAVRAVVISTTANPQDKRSWKIAYLEMYSPELKQQMEAAQATGTSPSMGRAAAQQHRFVRRAQDAQWFPMDSPEGERIVTEWASPGTNGITPVVCTP